METGSPDEAVVPDRTPGADSNDNDAYPLAGPPDDETIQPLDPRVRLLWWTSTSLVALWAVALVGVLDFMAPLPTPPGLLTGCVAAAGAVIAALLPILRYRRWRYALRAQDLWIQQGVLWVTISVIPFARLQFVDTRQGPLDRLYGLSQLVVHTAALGTSGQLPGLDAEEAERLRERLTQVQPDETASV